MAGVVTLRAWRAREMLVCPDEALLLQEASWALGAENNQCPSVSLSPRAQQGPAAVSGVPVPVEDRRKAETLHPCQGFFHSDEAGQRDRFLGRLGGRSQG